MPPSNSAGESHLFQIYAVIDSISPRVGSTAGGTKVTMTVRVLHLPHVYATQGQPRGVATRAVYALRHTRINAYSP